ncbi:hypothetical protein [Acidipropionibacterium timonense]|uniref:hypothetical protein n=1 Tax=Acidipropionibacterium timonense TaxID=2161818 RepID=UPI0010300E98|nr:hypothetical protein [Acidipropionibacterium timonense]
MSDITVPGQVITDIMCRLRVTDDGHATLDRPRRRRHASWIHDGHRYQPTPAQIVWAYAHGRRLPHHQVRRLCGFGWCLHPDHLSIARRHMPTPVWPVDLDDIAYRRAHGWNWPAITEVTGWTPADITSIPHVRRIHQPLQADAHHYLQEQHHG